MPIKHIKKDIKRHRPIDWFAMLVLISAGIVIVSILQAKIEQFSQDMDIEAQQMQVDHINLKNLIKSRR